MKTTLTALTLVAALGALPAAASADPAAAPAATPAPGAPAAAGFAELFGAELGAGGLTSDDAARHALRSSPSVQARQAELAAAAAEVDRATLAYVPVTTVTARYARLSDVGGGSLGNLVMAPGAPPGPLGPGATLVNVPLRLESPENQVTFQASLLVPVSDYFLRVAPAREAATLSRDAAKESVEVARQRGVADARIAYYAWVRARLGVVVAEKAAEQARAHLGDVKAALSAGTASQADLLRLESQIARSELLVTASRNLSLLAEEQLKTQMHLTSTVPLRIGEDIRVAEPSEPLPPIGKLWEEALARRPELAAFDRGQSAKERAVSVERAGYGPRLDLFANAQYSNPNPRVFPARDEFEPSWDAGAQLTWTLSDVPAAAARVRSAEARTAANRSDRTLLVDRIRLEVLSARQAIEEARAALDSTARGLAAAEESYRTRHLLFQNGRATAVELIDAETDLTRARLEALGARIDGRAAEVRLAYATGRAVCLTADDGGRTLARSLPRCP